MTYRQSYETNAAERDIESPKYDLFISDGDVEIRHHQPIIVAKTKMESLDGRDQRNAFGILAG